MARALVLLLVFVTAGCGFHLTGSRTPALNDVRVVYAQPYRVVPPPLIEALHDRLRDDQSTGKHRLMIRAIDTTRRVLAVSPEDARAVAFELIASVRFDFQVDGELRLRDQQLSTRREYSFDNSQRLAADAERRALLAAMHEELADLILLRLETALANPA